MKNDFFKENRDWEEDILEFCMAPRTRSEIIAFIGEFRTYVITKMLLPLIEAGKLNRMIPDKPKSSKQRYIRV